MEGCYNQECGYEVRHLWKKTCKVIKEKEKELAHKYVATKETPKKNQMGSVKDMMHTWHMWYKNKGLGSYGTFNTKGDINTPYILFKAKNMIDTEVREKNGRR